MNNYKVTFRDNQTKQLHILSFVSQADDEVVTSLNIIKENVEKQIWSLESLEIQNGV